MALSNSLINFTKEFLSYYWLYNKKLPASISSVKLLKFAAINENMSTYKLILHSGKAMLNFLPEPGFKLT